MRATFAAAVVLGFAFAASAGETRAPVAYRLGDWTLYALHDVANLGRTTLLKIPDDVPDAEAGRLFPDGTFPLDVNAFLLVTPERAVLFDTGNGLAKGGAVLEWVPKALPPGRAVTDVVLTHFHGDHVGGLLVDHDVAFPAATIHAPTPEWRHWIRTPPGTDPQEPLLMTEHAFEIVHATDDATYGHTKENPIRVGRGDTTEGPKNEQRFLAGLTGPAGQALTYQRRGSCCPFDTENGFAGRGLLDVYDVTYEGLEAPITLYFNMYDAGAPRVPVGFRPRFLAGAFGRYGDRVRLHDGEAEILPGVRAVPAYGHTPGHTGYLLQRGGRTVFVWGDLMHCLPMQARHPSVALSFDVDPAEATQARKRLLERAAREGWDVAGMHLPFPGVFRFAPDADVGGYAYAPLAQ